LKAEISTKPTIAPIVGTKGFMPLKSTTRSVADAHKSKNKIKLLFIVPDKSFRRYNQ
jgi:hypothetical protein